MRRWAYVSWLASALAVAAIGCGADMAGDDDDDNGTDAGASSCDMSFTVSPESPRAPATIVVSGSILGAWGAGLESYEWEVTRGEQWIETTPRDAAASEIEFEASVAGPYRIVLTGRVDGLDCTSYWTTINVTDPGANELEYRLALIPRADQPAPPQLQTIRVPGGADYDVGPRTLERGLLVAGVLQTLTGVTSGYLRAVATAEPALAIPRETFAAADGSFALRLLEGAYDVLVVPDGDLIAPVLLRAVEASALDGALSVPAADVVSGTVLRADDSPVVGARVALTVAGAPSTLAVTDDAGAFSVRVHTGGATAVTVVPGDGTLPQLELAAAAGLVADAAAPLAIRYGAGASARTEAFTVVAADGSTPVPGARVSFLARPVAGAGTITPGAGAPLAADATARVDATADAGGAVTALALPPAIYDVVVAPPSGGAGADVAHLAVIDLSAGEPALSSLALAAPAQVGVSAPGVPIGTRVTAVPTGVLGRAGGSTVEATTSTVDRVELSLVGGGEYEVIVHLPVASGRAPTRFVATAPAAGTSLELPALEVRDAISITGTVVSPDIAGGVGGVAVRLLCGDCTGPSADVPIAETVSGSGGAFTLRVPDPGLAQ